jgi:outer membrane protein TolC
MVWDKIFTDSLARLYFKRITKQFRYPHCHAKYCSGTSYYEAGKAGYFPSLSVGTDWTHQMLSKNSQFGAFLQDRSTDQYQLAGSLSWEADIWGK